MSLRGAGTDKNGEREKEGENGEKREKRVEGGGGTAGQREKGHILFVESDHF